MFERHTGRAAIRFVDVVASEFLKARTLPSVVIVVIVSLLSMAAYCIIDSQGSRDFILESPPEAASDITAQSVGIYALANLSFLPVISSVLIVSTEYSGGQLTASVLAVPTRIRLLLAKLVVVAAISGGQGAILSGFILIFYQGNLGDISVFATNSAAGYLGALSLGTAYWLLLGVLSATVAFIFRTQTVVMAVMITLAAAGLSLLMISKVFQYLPTNAGLSMFVGNQMTDLVNPPDLQPSVAATVVVLWTALAATVAILVFARRDILPSSQTGSI